MKCLVGNKAGKRYIAWPMALNINTTFKNMLIIEKCFLKNICMTFLNIDVFRKYFHTLFPTKKLNVFKDTRNLKNSRGRGVQSITLKQVSIEREVILEFKMWWKNL